MLSGVGLCLLQLINTTSEITKPFKCVFWKSWKGSLLHVFEFLTDIQPTLGGPRRKLCFWFHPFINKVRCFFGTFEHVQRNFLIACLISGQIRTISVDSGTHNLKQIMLSLQITVCLTVVKKFPFLKTPVIRLHDPSCFRHES
eukprot:Pompholyxophrys_punicea_v1_NODE_1172_length_884_cov_25.358944.p2 type:complete len:143 gc:universal NODE_1172_length_884_cov_25.358944:635-207(-)